MNSKTLYLIRGLPGAGKTTLAHRIADGWYYAKHETVKVLSADDYFKRDGGEYDWHPSLLSNAHEATQNYCETLMGLNAKAIIVANTFTRQWEMNPYRRLAVLYGYSVQEITVKTDLSDEALAGRCVHNVPVETITKMRLRWEN